MAEKEETLKRSSSDSKDDTVPKRVRLEPSDLKESTKELLCTKWKEQEGYIEYLESKFSNGSQGSSSELAGLRESEEKLKQQQQESTRRENVLVMRLATKEHEVQDLLTQIHDLKQAQNPSTIQMRSTLLDPAVNLLFQRMKTELDEAKEKLEQAQNDLSAWQFTPDSVTGKKLMAKCRMLIQENQELGRQLSQGRVAQLEAELALQKKYSDELKSSQDELNDFVIQLDEEVEGMQSTIMTLQQQLKEVKQHLSTETKQTQELRTKCDDIEKALAISKQQNTTVTSPFTTQVSYQDPENEEQMRLEIWTDTSSADGFEGRTGLIITSPKESTSVVSPKHKHVPSSFSISNLLSTDSHVASEQIIHTSVAKLENGEQGDLSTHASPPLEPSEPQTILTKGLPEGIGAEVTAFNVETVN